MAERIRCHLCRSENYKISYDTMNAGNDVEEGYKITDHEINAPVRVLSCRRCGFSFLNPRMNQAKVVSNYVSMDDDKYLAEERGRRRAAQQILRRLKRFKSGGRLLDIGCAAGFLLDEAQKQGWEVHGIELSQWAVMFAREKLKLTNVVQGVLQDANYPKNYFDAIVMTDVIEHLFDPKATLYDIRQILKPNGILCVTTPDIDSLISKLLKAKWWGIKRSHLFYFNRKTMSKILTATGFHPVLIKSHPRAFSLGYWFSNFTKYKPSMQFVTDLILRNPALSRVLLSVDLGDQMIVFARKSRQMKYLHELEVPQERTTINREKRKVVVVLPAYNAAKTLEITLKDIPRDIVDEVILVDDASKDNTSEVARQLGIKVIRHEKNKGYGGNQKTCYKKALESGADVVIMVHPDYQYDPTVIPQLIEPILKGQADAVFGSRMMKGGALEGGMPLWKYNANILLTALENVVIGIYLTEYHSGFRAYSSHYLTNVNFEANSDGFVFDTEIIVQGAIKFMKFDEVPIRTRYFDEASSIQLLPSIIYGLNILKTLLKFVLHKVGLRFRQFE